MIPMGHPDVELLQRLRTLSQFNVDQLSQLSDNLQLEKAKKGTVLVELGSVGEFAIYLIKGSVKLEASDGRIKMHEAVANTDLTPLAQIRPSIFNVIAVDECEFIKIDQSLLTRFAQEQEPEGEPSLFTLEQSGEEAALSIEILQDMMSGNLNLPSLPDVAHKIQAEMQTDSVSAESLAKIIQTDAAISAKLIKIANSALYRGQADVETLLQAIVRLGLETVNKQVMCYAIKELFNGNSHAMKSHMQVLWRHSQQVSCLSRILSVKLKKFDPEQAQLAGLVHDLGEIAILQYAQNQSGLGEDSEKLKAVVDALRPQITSMLLGNWNFTDNYIVVGEESEKWFRNPNDEPDLCDLVLLAQYHSFIGTDKQKELPPISKLPAFAKLGLSELTPAQIIEFMEESRAQMELIEANLAA